MLGYKESEKSGEESEGAMQGNRRERTERKIAM